MLQALFLTGVVVMTDWTSLSTARSITIKTCRWVNQWNFYYDDKSDDCYSASWYDDCGVDTHGGPALSASECYQKYGKSKETIKKFGGSSPLCHKPLGGCSYKIKYGFAWSTREGKCDFAAICSGEGDNSEPLQNFFASLDTCMKECAPQKGQNLLTPEEAGMEIFTSQQLDEICSSPLPMVKKCKDKKEYVERWTYDLGRRACVPFAYSGCDKVSKNFFTTFTDCDAMCVRGA